MLELFKGRGQKTDAEGGQAMGYVRHQAMAPRGSHREMDWSEPLN